MTTKEKNEIYRYAVEQLIEQFKEVNQCGMEVGTLLKNYMDGKDVEAIADSNEVSEFLKSMDELALAFENLSNMENSIESEDSFEELDDDGEWKDLEVL